MPASPEKDFREQAARYRAAAEELDDARRDLHTAMLRVRADRSMTIQAMADVLGVSRQRVADMLRSAKP